MIVPARMRANENFSDASLELLHSVKVHRVMSPSDAVDLESPLKSVTLSKWSLFKDRYNLIE